MLSDTLTPKLKSLPLRTAPAISIIIGRHHRKTPAVLGGVPGLKGHHKNPKNRYVTDLINDFSTDT